MSGFTAAVRGSSSSLIFDELALDAALYDELLESGAQSKGTSSASPDIGTSSGEVERQGGRIAVCVHEEGEQQQQSVRREKRRKWRADGHEAEHARWVLWASSAPTSSSSSASTSQPGVTLPEGHALSSARSLRITRTRPVTLTQLFLLSADSASYRVAHSARAALSRALEGHLIRDGASISVDLGEHGKGTWDVVLCEPVVQGIVSAAQTSILALAPSNEAQQLALPNGDLQAEQQAYDEDDEDDDLDIDEEFFSLRDIPAHELDDELDELHELATLPQQQPNGISKAMSATTTDRRDTRLQLIPLASHAPSSLALGVSAARSDEDNEPRVFVRTRALGHDRALRGVFSGDWAVAKADEHDLGRLVRVVAWEDAPTSARDGMTAAGASPLLRHNLGGVTSFSLHRVADARMPKVPVASAITLARVASPHSTTRAFQPAFLTGLRDCFQRSKRLVKQGDFICVPVSEEETRFTEEGDESDVLSPASGAPPSAAVYFVVTSLDLPDTTPDAVILDPVMSHVASGMCGALVDPDVTKMIQTGVEHAYVPDMAQYLGLASRAVSFVDEAGSPYARLHDYLAATRMPDISAFDLSLTILIKGQPGSGKKALARTGAQRAGFHVLEVDCFDLLGESEVKTEAHIRARFEKAASCAPCALLLSHIEALARKSQAMETGQEPAMSAILKECFQQLREQWKSSGFPVVVMATTSDMDKLPTSVLATFKDTIAIDAPGETERLAMLKGLVSCDLLARDVSLRSIAIQTAALVANDLVDLVRRARVAAVDRVFKVTNGECTVDDLSDAGVALAGADFSLALDKARSSYSESIGAPKIPNVTWDDVGGLASVKKDILDTVQLPLEHPELFAKGLKKRSGILLYGPPGTGKTLLAKAVATSCSLNFFSVKGPELLNMYIGESEANVRRVFQRARDAKPCVIFFDELDSCAPKRGNQGDSGGVMDRIVSQLLAELDGMSEGSGGGDVFVIGATNRPDLLDPALLRPGRFDRMLYLGVSDNHDAQLKIIQALTRKFKLHPETRLEDVANRCPFNYTGADFYALCSDAMLKAMTRKAGEVDAVVERLNKEPPYSEWQRPLTVQYYLAEMAQPEELEVLVAQQDFEAALDELVPSVSRAEIEHYQVVRRKFAASTMNKAAEEAPPLTNGVHPETNGDASLTSKVRRGKQAME